MSRTIPVVASTRSTGMPWPSLVVLGAATFVMVTAEMLPTAVLAPMAAGLGTTPARAAQLVSLWAGVVVVVSLPLVWLTRRIPRRDVVVAGLVVLAVSSALTALAPTYPAAVGARLLGAAAVGVLWATVNAHVADLVPDRLLGAAVSVVLGGATLGMVLGTPVARLVADLTGWRTSFVVLAGTAAVVAGLVVLVVPSTPVPRTVVRTDDAGPTTPQLPTAPSTAGGGWAARAVQLPWGLLALTGWVALLLVGHYGAYTYVTLLTAPSAALLPGGVSSLLLVYGVASAIGIALVGRVRAAATVPALVAAALVTAASLAALRTVGTAPQLGVALVALWGAASGAVPALAQTEIMRRAGRQHRSLAGALIPVLFNGGIALGAALASLVAGQGGVGALPYPAAAVVLVATLGLAVTRRRPPGH